MIEILLVFTMNSGVEQISDRIFTSFNECSEFVNTLAQKDVVNSDYAFRFISFDGALFEGQCIESKDWFLKQGKTNT